MLSRTSRSTSLKSPILLLKFFGKRHPEHPGRTLSEVEYRLTDHLGNTVVLFEDRDSDGLILTESMSADSTDWEVLQRQYYYPFGMPMQGVWQNTTDPRMDYLYNGKELEEELSLHWLAYGFRHYDPVVGRFTGVDPLADHPNVVGWTTYHYSYNNPIIYTDPDGQLPVPLITGGIGAAVGGVVGGAIGFFTTKGSLKQKLRGASKGAIGGAIGGFVVGSGAGLIAGAGLTGGSAILATGAMGGLGGAASSTAVQGLEIHLGERESISGTEVVSDALIGIPANIIGAGAGNVVNDAVEGAIKSKINKSALRQLKKNIRKTLKKDPNISTKEARRAGNVTAKEVMKDRTGRLSTVKVAIQSGSAVVIETGVQTASNKIDEKVGN